MNRMIRMASLAGAFTLATGAFAQVDVADAWVRASVPGQKASGAFMKLTAPAGAALVGVQTPVAGVAEVHEMAMDGDVMRMRAVASLDLPPGKTVELKPGGYHVMLMDLKKTLAAGETVPLTLVVQDKSGARKSIAVNAPVRALAAPQPASGAQPHMHGS